MRDDHRMVHEGPSAEDTLRHVSAAGLIGIKPRHIGVLVRCVRAVRPLQLPGLVLHYSENIPPTCAALKI